MTPLLELRNVSFRRHERTILKEVSFQAAPEEMMALIGPNGSGKTTLLKLICRLLRPASGEILLDNKPLMSWNRQALSRCVALVPQDLEIPFNFHVRDVVAQGRVPHLSLLGGVSIQDHRIVDDAMDAVGVSDLRHRVYSELSGGERQRAKIAIALAQQPKLMLLDEPTQHLDIGRQIELITLLRELNQKGIAIIAAMHDLNIVQDNFSFGILLSPGSSCVVGPISQVLEHESLCRAFSVDDRLVAHYFHATPVISSVQTWSRLR